MLIQCRKSWIAKYSRLQNGSRRMASNDAPFIHEGYLEPFRHLLLFLRTMDLTKDCMTGFWTRNWWIPLQASSLPRVILENSCLRLGRRKEEETRAHWLSTSLSVPTAAIMLSMMSRGISIVDFAIIMCAFKLRWDLAVVVDWNLSISLPLKFLKLRTESSPFYPFFLSFKAPFLRTW